MAGGKLVHYVEDLVERDSVIRRPDDESTVEAVGDKKIGPNGNSRSGNHSPQIDL
jgi:hypothetical protein